YQLRRQMQQKRRVDLIAVHGFRLCLEQITEVHLEDVDHTNASAGGDDGGESLEMRIVLVSGKEDELLDARCLPGVDQVVEHAMKGLAPKRCIAGNSSFGVDVDAVLQGGRAEHGKLGGEIVREVLDADRVAAQRHVRS